MSDKNGASKGKIFKGKKCKKKRQTLPYTPNFVSKMTDDTVTHELSKYFHNHMDYEGAGIQLLTDPFSVGIVSNLIQEEKFVDGLQEEMLDLIFVEKNNDLYKFQQTDDFKKLNKPHANAIRNLLKEQLLPWLRNVTGIPLNDRIDITCSRYEYTDTLLCHDDELDTRRIAFVYYLTPSSWKPEDGGALDLFSMDSHLQPLDVFKSVQPIRNQLVWFEVTETSHHQVAEVTSQDKCRLSVNGWFHAPPEPRAPRYVEPREPLCDHQEFDEKIFMEWINPIFLDPLVQSEVQEKFENESEIELQEFLREEKFLTLKAALASDQITWNKRGPPNKRCYERACADDQVPEIIRQCLALLQSELFFLTLSNLTGLSLHPLAANNDSDNEDDVTDKQGSSTLDGASSSTSSLKTCETSSGGASEESTTKPDDNFDDQQQVEAQVERSPKKRRLNSDAQMKDESKTCSKCRVELRRWGPGCYTLLHDTDSEGAEFALDLMLYVTDSAWEQEQGGYTSYIAKGEDEELLTVLPEDNCLALVYRDKETLRFVKHINSQARERNQHFYDFSGVYFE